MIYYNVWSWRSWRVTELLMSWDRLEMLLYRLRNFGSLVPRQSTNYTGVTCKWLQARCPATEAICLQFGGLYIITPARDARLQWISYYDNMIFYFVFGGIIVFARNVDILILCVLCTRSHRERCGKTCRFVSKTFGIERGPARVYMSAENNTACFCKSLPV